MSLSPCVNNVEDLIKKCAQNVYDELGSGHSESIYHAAMEVELRSCGIFYSTKAPICLKYKDYMVGWCIADLIIHTSKTFREVNSETTNEVNSDIVVELKATTYAPRAAEKSQLLGYLRGLSLTTGFLINFPQPTSNRESTSVDFIVLNVDKAHPPMLDL